MLKFINTQGLVYTPLICHNDIHVFNMVNVTVQHITWSISEFIEMSCVANTPTKRGHCFVNDFVYVALSSTRSCTLGIRCSILISDIQKGENSLVLENSVVHTLSVFHFLVPISSIFFNVEAYMVLTISF